MSLHEVRTIRFTCDECLGVVEVQASDPYPASPEGWTKETWWEPNPNPLDYAGPVTVQVRRDLCPACSAEEGEGK